MGRSWAIPMSAVAAALAVVLAGCGGPPPAHPGDGTDGTATEGPGPGGVPVVPFDGSGAYAYVEGLVMDGDQVRYRIPGEPGHSEAADWLQTTMEATGWEVSRQTFTGRAYRPLAEASPGAASYARSPTYCSDEDAATLNDTVFHNLIGHWDVPGAPTILLGAHWDSKENATQGSADEQREPVPGANDGASGVGVLLRLMEHVADGDVAPRTSLMVALFDGEDGFEDCHPLAGSLYHAHSIDNTSVARMVLLDMVGDPDARFPRETHSMASDPGMVELLWHHGGRTGLEANLVPERKTVTDDHIPYIERGIPAVDVIDYARPGTGHGFPPYWHTPQDDMSNIDADMLERVGSMVATMLTDVAVLDL